MSEIKQQLRDWIDQDRERLIEFLRLFIQAKSPNPPGDTRAAMAHIRSLLDAEGVPYQIIAPKEEFPNAIGNFPGARPGKHLVLNGHIDVFPVSENEDWPHGGPWSGAVADGKIWGRGACDMKCGTTASLFTYVYLHRIREHLAGQLTLTAVSDEETFGPWGARYLVEHHPEVLGDCCLNGEPSSPLSIRFGEKGPLWLRFTVTTPGAHSAYQHLSVSATKEAARLVADLETLTDLDTPPPGNVGTLIDRAGEATDRALGVGAAQIVQKVTVNIGSIRGGVKINMIPSECVVEADIRCPIGLEKQTVMDRIAEILRDHPCVEVEELNFSAPSWCDPEHEMVQILQNNVQELRGVTPTPTLSLGGTDARLWRYHDVPAFVYGPFPHGMGCGGEHVDVEDFLHIVRTHVLSAYDYLSD